jgi:lipopolysaccharide/colanic/teichoic acid biosynthesis glycosyltransferase
MIKRLFDIVGATTALVVLSPVYVATAYKVSKNLGTPSCSVRRAQDCMVSRSR